MEEEVKGCLDDCNEEKAPGPNGFNMKFYQVFWNVINKDVLDVLTSSIKRGVLSNPSARLSWFLSLRWRVRKI